MVIEYGTINVKNKKSHQFPLETLNEEETKEVDSFSLFPSKTYVFYIIPQYQFSLFNFYDNNGKIYVQ
jgi:hypothetical protein